MNMERGFSVPKEKTDVWAPVTPEKPVEQRPNHFPVGMQQNQKQDENWQDLLGIYTHFLQDQSCGVVGINPTEPPIQNISQNSSAGLDGVNHWNRGIQDVDKLRSFGQNCGKAGSYLQNLGDVVPPQQVSSLAELLGISGNTLNAPAMKASSISQDSRVESSWNNCIPDSMIVQNQEIGGSNLQQMPSSKFSVTCRPSYNLNLPQRSSDEDSSSVTRPYHLGPATPNQRILLKNDRISQVPHLSIEEISTNEEHSKENLLLPQQAEIGEREHNAFVSDTQSTASPKISTTKEKQNHVDGNSGEFDLNETPPQKAPKRRKHRPKVVKEAKPRRTPKAAKENKKPSGDPPTKRKYVNRKGINTPANQSSNAENGVAVPNVPSGDPPTKRKYVRRKGINTSANQSCNTENEVVLPNVPIGDPPTKRRYIRRKGIDTSENQSFDAENGVVVPNVASQGKSCKRALNFDMENEVGKKVKCKESDRQEDNNKGSDASISLDLDFHNTRLNRQDTCTVKAVDHNICSEQKQSEHTYNFVSFVDKISPQESPPPAAIVPPTGRTLNVIARSLNVLSANIGQSGVQGKYGLVHNHKGGGFSQLVVPANTTQQNLDGLKQPRLLSTPQLLEDLLGNMEKKEPRAYSNTEPTQPLMVSHELSEPGYFNKESIRTGQYNIESSGSNIINAANKTIGLSIPSDNTYADDFLEQTGNPRDKSLHAQTYEFHTNGGLSYFGIEEISALINSTYETNKVTAHWCMNSISSRLGIQKQMADIDYHPFADVQTNSSLTAVANGHLLSTSHKVKDPEINNGNEIRDAPARVSAKRQYTRRTPSNKMSSADRGVKQETRNKQSYGHHLTNVSGSREHRKNIFSVDDITAHMKNLWISNNGKGTNQEEQNALVPYEAIKKHIPRPKVDLDPETNRLWNLLMGIEGSEGAETMDEDKQKRWEEERRVFHGRVDSFIARMHLVQGDRRFSKWKGSVVDSVIGVYLTQNVTDHLSSSAFMSLAAKFPLRSTNSSDTSSQKAGNSSAEYEILVSHPDGTTCCQRMTRKPVYDHNTVKSSKLPEYGSEKVPSGAFLMNEHTRRTEEERASSQSSAESMSFQASEDIRSSSGSNSEVDDQVTGSNSKVIHGPSYMSKESGGITAFQKNQIQELGFSFPDKRPSNNHQEYENLANRDNPGATSSTNACIYPFNTNVLHHQRPVPTSKSTWQDMLMDTGHIETDFFAFLEEECTSCLTALYDTTGGTVAEDLHSKAARSVESRPMEQQTQNFKFHGSTLNHNVLTEHLEKKTNTPIESESRDNQHFINYKLRGMPETFHQESICRTDPVKSAEALRQNPTEKQKPSENITLESTEKKTVHASDVRSSKINTDSPARKQKAEKEQVKSFDWDSLRRQVQSEGSTRGRSRDIMDSLDYEALRNADVHEISNCIKERGMNNMLAARIKDFLNRLVKDHGSIDLEWLRDVQPDKVKDYLLSIRGLGLKSVECVRLLTLHHLAFPVDTNVGRIAVRLGWVPLQPLPESLQLHLLEMYPVLESIQKYLWPRLCMLDQETLYELHYQLITFGKVFCTKRQPNCNACPMRGECRHFASAFASARFALPGPEERRIVCSDIPTNSSKSCGAVTKPMSLPPPEDNIGSGPEPTTRNCEPIIEEPTTPESSVEVVERDIEDLFYEDPDEIPEIKLNIEEFATNLKSFIQENKEKQEGDMSKAIIALSPQFASIPMPKLKHVSRLRTEHQVYELPDSHPLLEGMDRREPDDPSPYLLALWTPSETADSIQFPEGKCSSCESGLCNSNACISCNSTREAQAQTVRGTILIPCRTAMRGSFPLNGTYFQVNEVFADDKTSRNPIHVPRSLIWNLPRRTVYFGTSVSTIFKGMSTEGIQYCFWRGFVCVRGFDQKTRAPRPLKARLHLPTSKIPKKNE